MRSQKAFKAGFTLVEIVIAMAILVIIAGSGFYAGFGQFQSYSLRTDRDTVVSLLQKARSRAMNNIGQVKHGFSIQGSNYVVFEGSSYATRNVGADQIIPKSSLVSLSGVSEVIFDQLTGDVSTGAGSITLTVAEADQIITINNEGGLSW